MTARTQKLNAEFKRYISELLLKRVKDPRITEMFTVLEVVTDADLSTAKVYVSVYSVDSEKAASTFAAICDNEPFIRREISKNMHIRKVPEFTFVLDKTMSYGQKIDDILNEINKKQN